jgi:6-phosphogluconolactonase
VHPSGKFVYASNRGYDSIATFKIDQTTGRLSFIDRQHEQIKWPRNFAIDPAGQFLLVANRDTNNIVVFRIDADTGKLVQTGTVVDAPKPICIKFCRLTG